MRTRGANRHRRISPRLANGDSREPFGHGLPPEIKQGLRNIALHENKSMAWVVEEVIIDYFRLRRPKYVSPKPRT